MPDVTIQPEGDDSFGLGLDSMTRPDKLLPGEYVMSMNTINRGGIIQTRPGSSPVRDGFSGGIAGDSFKSQGITFFTPSGSSAPALVSAAFGAASYSYAPFDGSNNGPLGNIVLNPAAKFVAWANCIQTTYYDEFGELHFLDAPRPVLVIQDGSSRAAYWDGVTNGHLDPTANQTPVGLWMAWSNNRLWVSRGPYVFASDIGNPLEFQEQQYLNEGRAFYLPEDCTGIVETPDRLGILCFTANTVTLIKSSIQDRTKWLETENFQHLIIPNVGCVAPRSIVSQYGTIWWRSSRGLINLDEAVRSNITSRLNAVDNEMVMAQYGLDSDISGICGAAYENFILQAVPVAGRLNNRILVMDQSSVENQPSSSWASYWEGWRPIEFARCVINGSDVLFCLSEDYDGFYRVWQLFQDTKTDNGIPITSYVITKLHYFDNRDYKRFKYAEVELQNIGSPTAVAIAVRGTKGAFQKVCEKDLDAVNGQVYASSEYGHEAEEFGGSRPQTRTIRTTDVPEPSDCNAECVESPEKGFVDKAFQIAIIWSGIAGVSAYRIFAQSEPQKYQGECEEDETGENRLVTPEGCGIYGLFSNSDWTTTNYAKVNYTKTLSSWPAGGPITFAAWANSVISAKDAYRKALARCETQYDDLNEFFYNLFS